MSNLFWLTYTQMVWQQALFPKIHCKPHIDDRPVLSGTIFINRNGLRWFDAAKKYRPLKALYNHWMRWSDQGVFARMMDGLVSEGAFSKAVMIDATYLIPQDALHGDQPAGESGGRANKGCVCSAELRAAMITRLHAVTDAAGRPTRFLMAAGQVSD